MVQLISRTLIADVTTAAQASARQRMNHNFHQGPTDNPHRFLNVLCKGTYIRPHRHSDPPKAETFIALEGRAAVLTFNEDGHVTQRYEIGTGCELLGVDLAPGIWHTVVALSDIVVCFEVKPGPWEPASDKEFASWAPREGDPACAGYLASLL